MLAKIHAHGQFAGHLNTARTYRQGVAFTQTTIYLGNPVILAKVAQLDKLSLK